MSKYKVIIGIITLIYAYFILNYPASYYNDDAYFFAKGIEAFSVIDFAPHFPGYPALIILGKIINIFVNDAKLSLFMLTAFCAIFLPFIIFIYIAQLKDEKTAFFAALLTLSSPYLNHLSLCMLSDSVGLFFLFLSLYAFQKSKYKTSGVLVAVSFFSRPSYLVIYVTGFIYITVLKREALKPLLTCFLVTSFCFLCFLFLQDGMLYLNEGIRFISGHFELWGTGQHSEENWFDKIFILANAPYLLLLLTIIKFEKKFILLYTIFFTYFIWILLAQNPDNIRHLIPLTILGNIFLASLLKEHIVWIILTLCLNLYILLSFQAKYSPIDQIAQTIQHKEKLILSNRSIEILRDIYHFQVADKYYQEWSTYLSQNKSLYIITTTIPIKGEATSFKGRFIGEQDYYLITK